MINSGVPGEWAPHIFSVLTEMPRIMLWVQAYWDGPGVNRCGSRFCRRTSIHYFQVFRSRAPLLPNHGRGRGDAITAVDLSYTRPCGRNVFVTQITLFGRDTIAADCGGSVSPPPPLPSITACILCIVRLRTAGMLGLHTASKTPAFRRTLVSAFWAFIRAIVFV